ncbi:MAG: CRISPR-associated endonuclease Cas2 [Candidatus Margulisiibacteriota bacterium]|jgi:CRISPR-associated protein Cas2
MLVVVSYDVMTSGDGGKRRLRRVAKACLNYGQRVQNSVFECDLGPDKWVQLRSQLISLINDEEDSLRFYFLGANGKNKLEHIGTKKILDLEEPMII